MTTRYRTYTDEELLRFVHTIGNLSELEQELARRLAERTREYRRNDEYIPTFAGGGN